MLPGRWLCRLASRCCSAPTREQILEPLLSDFQHQWIGSPTRTKRVFTLVHGYLAFWQTLAICVLRAVANFLLNAPARLTFERMFVGTYAAAIVLVIVYGFSWVRTGTLDPTFGLTAIRKLFAMFGPGLFITHYGARATSLRARLLVLATYISALGISWWINPDDRIGLTLYNFLYLGIVVYLRLVWPRLLAKRWHSFVSRPR